MDNPSAPNGKSEKYARIERERRWLLREPGLTTTAMAVVDITDVYFVGTRLRLRRMDDARDGSPPVYKLTQKVPGSADAGLVTNTYLSEVEYELVSRLDGQLLRKRRYSLPPFGVDVFSPPLDGLILAEAEFDSAEAMATCTPPEHAVAEVTSDPRFTGGRLATATRDEIAEQLAAFGLTLR